MLYHANTKCPCACVCIFGYVLRTRSLEIDAPHLYGVCRVMSHHLCVVQKALGSGFRVFPLAGQTPARQKEQVSHTDRRRWKSRPSNDISIAASFE